MKGAKSVFRSDHIRWRVHAESPLARAKNGDARADVQGVASFYTMYWKKPMGKTHLAICTNISCMLCGAYQLYNYIKQTYHIGNGDVTPDGLLSLEEAECLGSCGTAPAMQVNNYEYVENLTLDKLKAFLKERGL